MTPPLKRTHGFTLIELLVVIAIIGILAGFLAVGLPRALEAAKIAKLENNFNQIRIILTEYLIDNGTFPPAYGYLDRDAVKFLREVMGINIAALSLADLNQYQTGNPLQLASPLRPAYTRPWMDFMGHHHNEDLYDNFSRGYDTDRNGIISRLEFSPFGELTNPATQNYRFDQIPYLYIYDPDAPGPLLNEMNDQLSTENPRPISYFPINLRQFRKLSADWYRRGAANDPRPIHQLNANGLDVLASMRFPPPNYNAYVLISVGPSGNTWNMLIDFTNSVLAEANYSPAYYYHVLGMAAYFMATRDAEDGGVGDGELDFEYRARTRRAQADHPGNYLPDPKGPNAAGPIIFVGEG